MNDENLLGKHGYMGVKRAKIERKIFLDKVKELSNKMPEGVAWIQARHELIIQFGLKNAQFILTSHLVME